MVSLPSIFDGYEIPIHYFGTAFFMIGCMCLVNAVLIDPDEWDADGLPVEGHSTSSSNSPDSFINILWIVLYSECDPNYGIFIFVNFTTLAALLFGQVPEMFYYNLFVLVTRLFQIGLVLAVGIRNYKVFVQRAHDPIYIERKKRQEKSEKLIASYFEDQKL